MTVSAHRAIRVTALMLAVAALALALYPDTPVPNHPPQTVSIKTGPMVPAAVAEPSIANLPPLFGMKTPPVYSDSSLPEVATETASGQALPAVREGNDRPVELPVLVGIAGRLPDDAEVLLRLADGSTATLAVGERVAGMRLQAVGADRAVFVRGGRRIVMVLDGN